MNLKQKISLGLILLLMQIIIACSAGKEKKFKDFYYEKSEQKWLPAMKELNYKGTKLRNHVLLVVHAVGCTPCLQELAWWNKQEKEQIKMDITLIVIEKHKSIFDSFIEAERIDIPVFQDSSAMLFEQELIPTTPVKIYFNEKGRISVLDYMGAEGNIYEFLKQIDQANKQNYKISS